MFVITDELEPDSKDIYAQVKKDGFTIYAIVVKSNVNESELLDLASDSRKIILVQKFEYLNQSKVQAVYYEIQRSNCSKFLFSVETFI